MPCPKEHIAATLMLLDLYEKEGYVQVNRKQAAAIVEEIKEQFQKAIEFDNAYKQKNERKKHVPFSANLYSKSLFYGMAYNEQQKETKTIGPKINVTLVTSSLWAYNGALPRGTSINSATQTVQSVMDTIASLPGNVLSGLETLVDQTIGKVVKLQCINPNVSTPRIDPCGNLHRFGNIFGYAVGKLNVKIGVCQFGTNSNAIESYYHNLVDKICNYSVTGGGSGSRPKPQYNPVVGEVSELPTLGGISHDSSATVQDSSKIIYPSGISQKTLYGGNGVGYYAYVTRKNKNSTTAKAYIKNDTATLVLKDIAIKTTKKDDTSAIGLPANKDEAIKVTNTKAQLRYADPMINWSDFMDKVEADLASKFAALPVKNDTTMAEIRQKEYEVWRNYVQSKEIQELYKSQENMVKSIFTDIFMLDTNRKDYVFDPSQAWLDTLAPSVNKDYLKYKSLMELTRETMLKGVMAQAIKYKRQLLDLALKKAYVCSIPFRARIVRKEIEDVLRDVDSLLP